MHTDVTLGGYLLTRDEWNSLDDHSRLLLLHALGEGDEQRADDVALDYYESYELIIEATELAA
jgi:hypothetical protein